MKTSEYFFELLAEEIPAWMIETKLQQIIDQLSKSYRDFAGLDAPAGAIRAGATTRRLYFVVSELPQKQADREEEVKGPPLKAAYRDGEPTQALHGFLKKSGASIESITQRDDYVWLRRTVTGTSAAEHLQNVVPRLVESLRWPKMMRWGRGSHAYIRPIHSIVSILDGEPLPIELFGVRSGVATVGHRVLSPAPFEVSSYSDYVTKLRARHVIASADERVQIMRERARTLAHEAGGEPAKDESIWEQWRYLTECPGLIRAEFEQRFLSLPEEVLTTVMRVHQKQLPIRKGAKLSNSFLAVIDHYADDHGNAKSGNSFVTNARFADAQFFYSTDRKRTLASRLPDLEHLQFQEKLGDYRGKTARVVKLAAHIRSAANIRSDHGQVTDDELRTAAELCKTDLVTEMVKEFTELQGKIGGIYAREEGLPERVWQAIYDHYLPVSIEGELPRTATGAIVSLADKLDTLAGFFAIGLKPSGSKDPFALRRAAQGVTQILLNRAGWSIDVRISDLSGAALSGYDVSEPQREKILADLTEFIAERVRTLLELAPFSFAYDEVAAVMAAGWDSLHDAHDRLVAVREARGDAQFLSILDSAKRIANITAGSEAATLRSELLEHPTEKRLAELIDATSEQIDELVAERAYGDALASFAGLAPELEKFFDDVMVMVDDPSVRDNRVALLRRCGTAVTRIADVTKIVVDRKSYQARRG